MNTGSRTKKIPQAEIVISARGDCHLRTRRFLSSQAEFFFLRALKPFPPYSV